MKISCLGVISTIFLLVFASLIGETSPKQHFSYCPDSSPSTISVGMTAYVVHVSEGSFLPLYSEAYATGGTNGGVANGAVLTIADGPYCSQGTTWWKVRSGNLTGYVYETKDGVRYLSPTK